MKKSFLKIMLGIVLACTLFVGFLYVNNDIGVTKAGIEAEIRSSQKIEDDWIVDGSISEEMAAFISYPQDKTDHTFSIYVNHPGLSFGYFFRAGGSIAKIERSIEEYTIKGCNERAFISMNTQRVARLEIDDGASVQVMEIDCDKPFVIVLPVNAGNVTFYDENGKSVEY